MKKLKQLNENVLDTVSKPNERKLHYDAKLHTLQSVSFQSPLPMHYKWKQNIIYKWAQ